VAKYQRLGETLKRRWPKAGIRFGSGKYGQRPGSECGNAMRVYEKAERISLLTVWILPWSGENQINEKNNGTAVYALSPRMRRASWMSLGIMVTLLA
jgi:hypothetical protein